MPRELLRPQIPQQKDREQARSHKNFTNPRLCRSELARELLQPQIPQQKDREQARSHKNFTNPPPL